MKSLEEIHPYISIHALLAESDLGAGKSCDVCGISIHALLAESDLWAWMGDSNYEYFYPRSPCGERRFGSARLVACAYFYPRSPCGERLEHAYQLVLWVLRFLSTLSLRRATHYDNYNLHCVEISIHALLAESDSKSAQNSGALLRI